MLYVRVRARAPPPLNESPSEKEGKSFSSDNWLRISAIPQ